MMVTGISRADLPVCCTNPSARGPCERFGARLTCAVLPMAKHNSRMAHWPPLRYKLLSIGGEHMEVNDRAPDFSLSDQNGNPVSLKGLCGKTVVLFFFPKADTPGWTIEACGFRDAYKKLQKAGAVILGISGDTPDQQKKFEEKYDLPYALLSDPGKQIASAYGVMKEKNMYGKKVMGIERTTFIIGPDGKIARIFPKVKA
jgi:thioredoxin-dependent peroxiredoxin